MSGISGGEARVPRSGPGPLAWEQRRVADGVVVRVAGELDLATSEEFGRRLMKLVESGRAAVVVLDLSDLHFIDGHSIGLIIDAWAAAKCRGRRLEVDGLRGLPAQAFGVLGLEPLLARRVGDGTAGRGWRGRYEPAPGIAAGCRFGGANGAG